MDQLTALLPADHIAGAALAPEALDLFLSAVATADDDGDLNLYDQVDYADTVLSPADFIAYCDAFEICPEHYTDLDVCADDELDCAAANR